MRKFRFMLLFAPDGGSEGGGATPPAKGEEIDFAAEMKKMQAAHAEEIKKAREELEREKAAHAKDLRELLMGKSERKGAGEDPDEIEKMYKNFKKKYGG